MKTAEELLEVFHKHNFEDLSNAEEHLALNWFVFLSCPDPQKHKDQLLELARDISVLTAKVSEDRWTAIAKKAVEMCELIDIHVSLDNLTWLFQVMGWQPNEPIVHQGVH